MAEFTSHAPGTPCWVDLMSPDVDASAAFYSSLFGWDTEDQFDDEGNRVYVSCSLDGKAVAGIGGPPPEAGEMPAVWNTYIAVDDCAAAAEAVTHAGGTVMMPPMQVMAAGEMAVFIDPVGAVFSVWKAGEHHGVQLGNVANTYSWNELMTRDISTATSFYSDVFGWNYDVADMPDGPYHLIKGGPEGLGGMMAMPPDVPDMVPSHWAVYFMVDDLEASLAKVTAEGGNVVMPAFPVPGVGTCAVAHDPAGGNFSLLQPAVS